jgi:hypothetical protein
MELNDATNQVAADDTDLSTVPGDEGVSGEATLDEYGNAIEAEEEEEEIDLDDDLKLKLPKSQAEKLRLAAMRQADYTRKTQELAEARKAFEAERQSIGQADEQEFNARAAITVLDRQLAQFANVNWNQWQETDPFEAQKAFMQFQQLKDARTNSQNRSSKERRPNALVASSRKLPGWSRKARPSSRGIFQAGLPTCRPSSRTSAPRLTDYRSRTSIT